MPRGRFPAHRPPSAWVRTLIYGMPHAYAVTTADTSIRVSRSTLSELERFRKALRTRTADETIKSLMRLRRRELIARVYGSARLSTPFRETDRLDVDH